MQVSPTSRRGPRSWVCKAFREVKGMCAEGCRGLCHMCPRHPFRFCSGSIREGRCSRAACPPAPFRLAQSAVRLRGISPREGPGRLSAACCGRCLTTLPTRDFCQRDKGIGLFSQGCFVLRATPSWAGVPVPLWPGWVACACPIGAQALRSRRIQGGAFFGSPRGASGFPRA